ncbi:molybdenum cofactor guanylyltransferase [Fictibacillus phosphorivorans]|uniref:molybdenum cofactor guanylyltransferase n=1 Tax=Fictibacillus phosphorivorans TaxID=1221500 RepID=UPI00204169CF|nr:molybdenum cofactor guanylyltransferase [Fictibacillus phosphorivorans]MCM3716811.1 molybdenum cofactor guanylyltransferase [Fictibacillus phosphorivorans]MCM3774640.1 molybdenum cofactor guanylyltransferase [Fictibacillus phosphorivorans]
MDSQVTCAGIVLAGGESRRFGSPKAIAKWNNKTFIEYSIASLKAHTDKILIITREELLANLMGFSSRSVRVLKDVPRYQGKGPLAGLYTGMISQRADYYLVIPCDMPLMSCIMYRKWLAVAQEGNYDCVIPVLNGKIFPLNGVYKITCLPDITSCLHENTFKVLKLLQRKNTSYLEVEKDEEHFFKNVNTTEELEKMIEGK